MAVVDRLSLCTEKYKHFSLIPDMELQLNI